MPENATVIKEIQSKFTADITDYRKKVEQLSGLVSSMTKNLDATARKLQGQKEKFDGLTKSVERTTQQTNQLNQKLSGLLNTYHAIQAAASTIDLSTPIQKQADAAKAAVEQIDIDSGEMLSVDQAKARLDQLAQSGVEAAEKLDRLQAAIDSIGTENQGCANKIESLAVALKNAGQDKFVFLSQGMERLESKIDATTTKLGSLGDKLSDTVNEGRTPGGQHEGDKEFAGPAGRELEQILPTVRGAEKCHGAYGLGSWWWLIRSSESHCGDWKQRQQ